jgi:hypothetical protein
VRIIDTRLYQTMSNWTEAEAANLGWPDKLGPDEEEALAGTLRSLGESPEAIRGWWLAWDTTYGFNMMATMDQMATYGSPCPHEAKMLLEVSFTAWIVLNSKPFQMVVEREKELDVHRSDS